MSFSYQDFAGGLSVGLVVLYTALVLIAARRALYSGRRLVSEREIVAAHSRHVEGPALTMLLVLAVFTLVSAVNLDDPNYEMVIRLAVSFVRGTLFVGGLYIGAWYMTVRDTWR